MISDTDIKKSIDNSIRSIFQMIVLVSDHNDECLIIDHDDVLSNISADKADEQGINSYQKLRKCLLKNTHPEDRETVSVFTDHDLYVKELSDHIHLSAECRLRHTDSKYYWSEIIICNTTAENSTEGNDCLFMIRDIDERKRCELDREAEERAVLKSLQDQYDALFEENMTDQQTGCYNRKGLKYYSDIVIDDARENGNNLFVCIADLNGLKHLNDTYGHAAGDEALSAVSRELINAAPAGSKVVRIGGDEFLIFASVSKDSEEVKMFAGRVDDGIREYNESHSNPYTVGTSYGWVMLPPRDDMTSLDEYIEMADMKMYQMRMERDKYRRD